MLVSDDSSSGILAQNVRAYRDLSMAFLPFQYWCPMIAAQMARTYYPEYSIRTTEPAAISQWHSSHFNADV